MAKKDIWMPLNIGDYLADTMSLTAEQHGVYLLLLMDYWKSGPLADDDRQLCATGKVTPKAWKAEIGPIIRRFFHKGNDGLLHQKRADAEITKTGRISEVRRSAAIERHNRGKEPEAEPMQTACKTDANASQKTEQTASKQGDIARVHALAPPLPSDSDLRSAPNGAGNSIRDVVWRDGPALVRGLIGKSDSASRTFLGSLVKKSRDDCARVYAALREAESLKPLDPAAWLTRACTPASERNLLSDEPYDPTVGTPMTGGF